MRHLTKLSRNMSSSLSSNLLLCESNEMSVYKFNFDVVWPASTRSWKINLPALFEAGDLGLRD